MTNRLFAALLALLLAAPSGAFAASGEFAHLDFIKRPAPLPVASISEAALPSGAPASVAAPAAPAPVQSVSAIEQSVAPQLEAIAKPAVSAESSAKAGDNTIRVLQGGKAEDVGSAVNASGAPASAPAPLAPPSSQPAASQTASVPSAPAPKAAKAVSSRRAYAVRRAFLAFVSATFGVGYSLPPAGPRLTVQLLKQASSKDAVLSDIDDTLAKYNTVLEPQTAAAIVAVRKAGKVFAAITDRPDAVKPGSSQLSAFDSLSSIPAADRAGIIVATNGGGKIYQYQADGSPKLLFEEPGLPEFMRPEINEAAAVIKERLAAFGTSMKSEFHNPYGYGLILKEGTPEPAVKALAAEFYVQLRLRGLNFEVEGRMAKDPKLAPYLTFSKLNKSLAVERIAELEKLKAGQVVILGDSMYAPKESKELSRTGRAVVSLADRVAGPLPLTGNATDRNMERALPGALTLSVGGTADASMRNGWVLEAKGPAMTRRVLDAVASRASSEILAEHASLVAEKSTFSSLAQRLQGELAEFGNVATRFARDTDDRIAALERQYPALRRK